MDPLERLSSLFEKFPGIGPRQAQRFVQHVLRLPSGARRELAEAVQNLGTTVHQCPLCLRFSTSGKGACSICRDENRKELLAVVASDADLLALERSRTFPGRYFVLGGLLMLSSERTNGLRVRDLIAGIPRRVKAGLQEIILAFPANPEGDATSIRIREELVPLAEKYGFKISTLGRGLSTGSELEYADPETLKNALESRK